MQSKKTLMIIDAYNFLFRAYFALPALEHEGLPVGAVYGFINIISKYIGTKPEYLVIASDTGKSTFREHIYPLYKANRPPAPCDLTPQFDLLKEAIDAFDFNFIQKDGFEADDIIATLVKNFKEEDIEIVVVSSDKDLMQLVQKNVRILDPIKNKFFDKIAVKEKFGVDPGQIVDYLSLTGDASDNVPGVPGVGPKTAVSLLDQFKTLESIDPESVKKPKLRQNLVEFKDQLQVSKRLVTLCKNVEITKNLEDLKYKQPNEPKLLEFLQKYDFKALVAKLITKKNNLKSLEQSQNFKESSLDGFLQRAKYSGIVGIYKVQDFIYVATKNSTFKSKAQSFEQDCMQILQDPSVLKVFHGQNINLNLKESYDDLEVMSYTVNTTKTKLEDLILIYPEVAPEECNIAAAILEIYQKIKDLIVSNKSLVLYYKIDRNLKNVVNKIQQNGVLVDTEYLKSLSVEFTKDIKDEEEKIFKLAECKFLVGSPKQLGDVLFNKMDLPFKKKSKTGTPSTDSSVLEKLFEDGFEIAGNILKWRKLTKLQNTYIEPLLLKSGQSQDKRIHTTYSTCATLTGRFNSANPNLQNIPRQSYMRKIFVAKKGFSLISADYSQVELRILAQIANVKELKEALKMGKDLHQTTAAQVFETEDVTKEMRSKAKAINFGIIYGITAYGLAAQINTTKEEASRYIESYFKKYPRIKEYMDSAQEEAAMHGFVKTIMNRRCYITNIKSKNFLLRSVAKRSAINAPIQGTAADIIRYAIIKLADSGFLNNMIMQVHDELVFEVPEEDTKDMGLQIKNIMESCCKIPMKVDLKIGKNLGEMSAI